MTCNKCFSASNAVHTPYFRLWSNRSCQTLNHMHIEEKKSSQKGNHILKLYTHSNVFTISLWLKNFPVIKQECQNKERTKKWKVEKKKERQKCALKNHNPNNYYDRDETHQKSNKKCIDSRKKCGHKKMPAKKEKKTRKKNRT